MSMIAYSNSITAAAIAVVLGLAGTSAHAAATGSYTASCKNIVDDGTTVRADCKKKNGSYVGASLAYKICQGQVWNDNGTLKCTPQGSFKNSCNSVAWNESYLMANCRKKNKQYLWNSGFNYNMCLNNSQDIANCDGSLQCGGC
jgi:hypothetical protein